MFLPWLKSSQTSLISRLEALGSLNYVWELFDQMICYTTDKHIHIDTTTHHLLGAVKMPLGVMLWAIFLLTLCHRNGVFVPDILGCHIFFFIFALLRKLWLFCWKKKWNLKIFSWAFAFVFQLNFHPHEEISVTYGYHTYACGFWWWMSNSLVVIRLLKSLIIYWSIL